MWRSTTRCSAPSSPTSRRCAAPANLGYGIDGCSAPNFATTMHGLALAMARMADPRGLGPVREAAARRLVAAMIAHPLLVAGEGRACSELMAAMDGVAVKTGAEAVYVAILPAQGLGVALKIEDGATRASECAITALLVRLGAIAADNPAAARRLRPAALQPPRLPCGGDRPRPWLLGGRGGTLRDGKSHDHDERQRDGWTDQGDPGGTRVFRDGGRRVGGGGGDPGSGLL